MRRGRSRGHRSADARSPPCAARAPRVLAMRANHRKRSSRIVGCASATRRSSAGQRGEGVGRAASRLAARCAPPAGPRQIQRGASAARRRAGESRSPAISRVERRAASRPIEMASAGSGTNGLRPGCPRVVRGAGDAVRPGRSAPPARRAGEAMRRSVAAGAARSSTVAPSRGAGIDRPPPRAASSSRRQRAAPGLSSARVEQVERADRHAGAAKRLARTVHRAVERRRDVGARDDPALRRPARRPPRASAGLGGGIRAATGSSATSAGTLPCDCRRQPGRQPRLDRRRAARPTGSRARDRAAIARPQQRRARPERRHRDGRATAIGDRRPASAAARKCESSSAASAAARRAIRSPSRRSAAASSSRLSARARVGRDAKRKPSSRPIAMILDQHLALARRS